MFAIIIGACAVEKLYYYNKKVSISVLVIWAVIEPFRLYYGFLGNLKERVPELATYLLISVFPQTPLILYLAYVQPVKFPIDYILGSFMLVFLLAQFGFGLRTVQSQIRTQTAQFMRLCEDEDDDDLPYNGRTAAIHHRKR